MRRAVVVTGALGDVGQQVLRLGLSKGWNMVGTDIFDPSDEKISGIVAGLYADALGRKLGFAYYQADLCSDADLERVCSQLAADFPNQVIGLASCAGVVSNKGLGEETREEILRVLNINTVGPMLFAERVADLIAEAVSQARKSGEDSIWGSVVFISSLAGRFGAKAAPLSYTLAKGAIQAGSKQLAKGYGEKGIRVFSLAPGPIDGKMLERWTPEFRKSWEEQTLLKEINRPEHVAAWILTLLDESLSPMATAITIDQNSGYYVPL